LDLVRATAIVLVLFAHGGLSNLFGVRLGTLGVEIFFVLSGFLIGQILIKDFSNEVSTKTVLHFWVRRWFRTLPLYYAVVLVKFIFFDSALGWKIIVYFLFLQNNFVGIDFIPVSWSLVIEEWFYLIVPVLMFVFFQKGLTKQRFTFFLIAFILFENLLRLSWVVYSDRGYSGIVGNFPFRLDSLMIGVLLANIKINYNHLYTRITGKYFYIMAFSLWIILLFAFGSINKIAGLKDQLLWTRTLWFCLISITIGLQIPFIESIKLSSTNLFGKVITWVSLYAYAMYLIHPYIYQLIMTSKKHTTPWLWQAPLAVLITFIISSLIYRFFEKPMINFRYRVNISKQCKKKPK